MANNHFVDAAIYNRPSTTITLDWCGSSSAAIAWRPGMQSRYLGWGQVATVCSSINAEIMCERLWKGFLAARNLGFSLVERCFHVFSLNSKQCCFSPQRCWLSHWRSHDRTSLLALMGILYGLNRLIFLLGVPIWRRRSHRPIARDSQRANRLYRYQFWLITGHDMI